MTAESVDPKLKCDALLELWQRTGARITERRSYEWKIAFGVWGAMLVAMGEVLTHSKDLRTSAFAGDHWGLSFWIYLSAGLSVAALHAFYAFGYVRTQNHKDSLAAKHYEKALTDAIGIRESPLINDSLAKAPLKAAFYFEAGITLFLAVMGPLIVHALS